MPRFSWTMGQVTNLVEPMSALGQKLTYAVQWRMSASPPIATTKADIRKRACPLCTRKQTCAAHKRMSALGQKRTSLPSTLRCYERTDLAWVSKDYVSPITHHSGIEKGRYILFGTILTRIRF